MLHFRSRGGSLLHFHFCRCSPLQPCSRGSRSPCYAPTCFHGVAEPPSEATNPRGTVGCYPEGCPTRSDVRYVDENNPETEVEGAPAENAAPAESPVPQAIPPAVTGLPASEEEPPLSVDPPAPQTSSPVPLPLCNDRLAVCGTPEPDVSKDTLEEAT